MKPSSCPALHNGPNAASSSPNPSLLRTPGPAGLGKVPHCHPASQARPSQRRPFFLGSQQGACPHHQAVHLTSDLVQQLQETQEDKEQGQLPVICAATGSKVNGNLQISVMCWTCFPLWSNECCQCSTSMPGGMKPSPKVSPSYQMMDKLLVLLLSLQRWHCHSALIHCRICPVLGAGARHPRENH